MILVFAVVIGVGVALLRGGAFRRLADLQIRLGWLALLALLVQMYVIYYPAERIQMERSLHAALMMGSYAILTIVVLANRRLPAMSVIGLGLILNLAVMGSNGGFMPVTREAILTTGTRTADQLPADGERLHRSKDVLLPSDQTQLWILSDVITAPDSVPLARVYSIGDLVVALGTFLLLQAAMVPHRKRRYLGEEVGIA
ncbi:MAG: DUF5317 domain-containing protein [Chloroflexota bacterium]